MIKKYFLAGVSLITLSLFSLFFVLSSPNFLQGDTSSTTNIDYQAQVCTYKTPWLGDHYGEPQPLGCSHNVLYNSGANMTRDLLGGGANYFIRNISLCNASAGCATSVAAASEAYTTLTMCGFNSTQGAYTILGATNGNWTISNTFTSTCNDITTNATRLTNATGANFAGNTFTLATLQNNDQLTVNWTIMTT